MEPVQITEAQSEQEQSAWSELDEFFRSMVRDRCGGVEHFACVQQRRFCGVARCHSAVLPIANTLKWMSYMRELGSLLGADVRVLAQAKSIDGPYRFTSGKSTCERTLLEGLEMLHVVRERRALEAALPEPLRSDAGHSTRASLGHL